MGFGKEKKGVMIREKTSITLGTLASVAAVLQDNVKTFEEDFRMLKHEVFLHLKGGTFVEGDGPIVVGIASGDLAVAEIAEAMVTDGPFGRDQRVEDERATRPVWGLYMLEFVPTSGSQDNRWIQMATGKKPRWSFSNPDGFNWFAFNMGSGALTTGGVIELLATYFGLWLQ